MNSRHYHTPPDPTSNRIRCPVCQQAVYSRAGIHPQCAVRQADPPRLKVKRPGSLVQHDVPATTPAHAPVGATAGTPGSETRASRG
jgi:hypothetical protein